MSPDLRARVLELLHGYRMSVDPIERIAPNEPVVRKLLLEIDEVMIELRHVHTYAKAPSDL